MSQSYPNILTAIRERRVVRHFTSQPVSRQELLKILEAARWAPSGGNRRLHRFMAIMDSETIRLVRAVSPGMSGHPTALVIVCIDWKKMAAVGYEPQHAHRPTIYIDVGTAAENMLLAAHALGLAAGPVTSFSKAGVRVVLSLPEWLSPDLIVCLGHAAPRQPFHQSRPHTPTRIRDLVIWERFEEAST